MSSEKNSSRTIHVVSINSDQNSFSLGRGHDSELRINDISVSRKHASLEYKNNKFVLTDLKSKFGTLMLISEPVKLSEHNNKTFQIGRTVVTIKAKSEAPWRRKNPEKGDNFELKGAELQRMEELLRGTQSLSKTYTGKPEPKDGEKLSKQYSNDIEDRVQKLSASEVSHQGDNVIEINGKRYIILKELDDKPSEE